MRLCKKLTIKDDENKIYVFDKETKILHNNIGPAYFSFKDNNIKYKNNNIKYLDFIENGLSVDNKPSYIAFDGNVATFATFARPICTLKYPGDVIYNNFVKNIYYNSWLHYKN